MPSADAKVTRKVLFKREGDMSRQMDRTASRHAWTTLLAALEIMRHWQTYR